MTVYTYKCGLLLDCMSILINDYACALPSLRYVECSSAVRYPMLLWLYLSSWVVCIATNLMP
jgi:hypothetical protein